MKKENKIYTALVGALCGFLNGFFGTGGGIIIVPYLRKIGLSANRAHATSVAIILPTALVSTVFYLLRGDLAFSDSITFVLAGVFGAVLGPKLLKKASPKLLKRIFGALIIFASVRMILR